MTKGRSLTMLKRSTLITAAQDLDFVLKEREWTLDQVVQKVLDGTVENPVIRDLLLNHQDVKPLDKAQIRTKYTAVIEPLAVNKVSVAPVNPVLLVPPVELGIKESTRREGARGGRYVTLEFSDGRQTEVSAVQVVRLNAGIRIRIVLANFAEDGKLRQFYVSKV